MARARRKNGKSELLAGIALLFVCADDEEGAEVYGAAKDREQASLVFDVARRMVELSPLLSRRLRVFPSNKRIVDPKTSSFYRVIAADATGNLGQNRTASSSTRSSPSPIASCGTRFAPECEQTALPASTDANGTSVCSANRAAWLLSATASQAVQMVRNMARNRDLRNA